MILTVIAGCHETLSADLPETPDGLRHFIDSVNACALLLSGSWPIDFDAESSDISGADALVASGWFFVFCFLIQLTIVLVFKPISQQKASVMLGFVDQLPTVRSSRFLVPDGKKRG
ncbi:MAG: hypothetical protein ACRYGA_00255 [Janthinobacterium lividum]